MSLGHRAKGWRSMSVSHGTGVVGPSDEALDESPVMEWSNERGAIRRSLMGMSDRAPAVRRPGIDPHRRNGSMRYAAIVYIDPERFARLDERQRVELDEASFAEDEALRATGQLLFAEALQPITEAVTVRVREGRVSTTIGPFAETAEHLGGIVLLEARDLNEAVAIVSRYAIAELGSIEVRPVMDLEAAVRARRAAEEGGG
jgi:hypothetical protein